jgi:hypothetical protein
MRHETRRGVNRRLLLVAQGTAGVRTWVAVVCGWEAQSNLVLSVGLNLQVDSRRFNRRGQGSVGPVLFASRRVTSMDAITMY